MAEPILKWAGGKRQLMDQVLRHFPSDFKKRRFHEPMFGAGAVTFKIEPTGGTINDINGRLMSFYKVVRERPNELIEFNRKHRYSEEYYYRARERYNLPINGGKLDPIEEASLLLYLNRTCYNGLYRVNGKGEFNVPFGGYKNPDFVQEERILAASKILKHLNIYNKDFSYVLRAAKEGDIVYFDPPYQPVSTTSAFTAYNKDGFGIEEQHRLANLMSKLNEKNVLVVLSNSAADEMVELYSGLEGFSIHKVDARRAINCNGTRRGKVGELIVTNVKREVWF
jgi:DNA adenine methylase